MTTCTEAYISIPTLIVIIPLDATELCAHSSLTVGKGMMDLLLSQVFHKKARKGYESKTSVETVLCRELRGQHMDLRACPHYFKLLLTTSTEPSRWTW